MQDPQQPQQQQGPPPSTASGQRGAAERSPLDFVACSACRRSFDPAAGPQFYLTTCSHTVCDACTFPNQQPPEEMDNSLIDCPECSTRGPILRLVEGADMQGLAPCFRPLSILLDELGMAVRWQAGNLVEQLSFFQAKCTEQRTTLGKLGSELKKMKALKSLVTELTAENTSLRSENAALKAQLAASAPSRVDSRGARAQGQPNDPRSFHSDPGSFGAGASNARKRAADDNLPREITSGAKQAPLNSRSSSAAPRDLPVQPTRLSLTPAHARDHSARRHQGQAMRVDAAGFEIDGGRASLHDQRAPKDKLADYAYDPSRGYSKPASRSEPRLGDPSRPSSSRPSSSHRAFATPVESGQQQIYHPSPQQHDAHAQFASPRRPFSSAAAQDNEQPFSYYPAQQQISQDQSNVRTSFLPPSRGITPMPSRFGPSQAAPQHYAPPPPTPQRQPFQPLQPQQQFDLSRAAAGTPRPRSSSFVYRDPGGSTGGGFVSANHLR